MPGVSAGVHTLFLQASLQPNVRLVLGDRLADLAEAVLVLAGAELLDDAAVAFIVVTSAARYRRRGATYLSGAQYRTYQWPPEYPHWCAVAAAQQRSTTKTPSP